jgi:hypothetical protein
MKGKVFLMLVMILAIHIAGRAQNNLQRTITLDMKKTAIGRCA